MDENVLADLIRKADLMPSLSSYKKHFALFSKSGFTTSLARKAARDGVLLFGKKDITLQ